MLSDLEAWPQRIETVDVVELLTPAPVGEGSCVRLKQPKLPEGTWEVTVWDAPSYFEFRQKSGGVTNVAGHRVEALEEGRSCIGYPSSAFPADWASHSLTMSSAD